MRRMPPTLPIPSITWRRTWRDCSSAINMDLFSNNATVVLVHGAWADGSSWNRVILPLLHQGLKVICAPIPLTSLSDDAAALNRVLGRTDGPVLLAGHAYAGAVIAAATDEKVRSLVYIAALAPDAGETVAQVFYREEPHPQAPHLQPDAYGLIWMPQEGFQNAFAQNASDDVKAVTASVQRPIAVQCIQEPAPKPAWRSKPSWFLIAEEDRMINPKTQHFIGRADGSEGPSSPCRSHAASDGARSGRRHNT